MPIISLAALTVLDAKPSGHIKAAHAAGFSHAGLRLQPLLASDEKIAGISEKEQEIVSLLAQTGVKPLETGVFPIKAGFDIELYGPVLSFSHRIGARYITCPVEDEDKPRRLQAFQHLCDLAGTCGLEALVEFNPYSGCKNLAEALELVQTSEKDNARLLIDVLHLARSGGSPDDLRAIDPDLIALVHLCDANPPSASAVTDEQLRQESRTARLYPGEGVLWLEDLLDVIPADTPLSIEAPSAAHAHLSAEDRARAAMSATQALLARHISG
ncbi:MAG: sugar phosphate isomerase/epimerase [Beijerinckiaceae bacterium]|jgi:sugar phosphate isomerase/epimerase|nr:sugar phosphate isomerase/epimerase [Beijerinckiaceae bacterium]